MPGEFPCAKTSVTVKGSGWMYPLLIKKHVPVQIIDGKPAVFQISLDGGDGRVFVVVPEPISKLDFLSHPVRKKEGIHITARVMGNKGLVRASLPVRIDLKCGDIQQSVYSTTRNGVLDWTVPYLRDFPAKAIDVTVTDMASGKSAVERVR